MRLHKYYAPRCGSSKCRARCPVGELTRGPCPNLRTSSCWRLSRTIQRTFSRLGLGTLVNLPGGGPFGAAGVRERARVTEYRGGRGAPLHVVSRVVVSRAVNARRMALGLHGR